MEKALHPLYTLFIILACLLTACEKPVIDDGGKGNAGDGKYRVTFSAFEISQASFDDQDNATSRATKAVKDVCTRMTIAIFNNNSKVVNISKENTDKDFGKFTADLNEGVYNVVVIAHSGEGNATITSPQKITFKDYKLTDTFYAYKQIEVGGSTSYQLTLKRAVAMIRLVVEDATPSNVGCMKLYYTGGSSTLDATTGYGCVNSKQTEYRMVGNEAHNGPSTYEVYTFPHESNKTIKMEITALASSTSAEAIYTKTLDGIEVQRNTITQLSGKLYDESPSTGRGFDISIDDAWDKDSQKDIKF